MPRKALTALGLCAALAGALDVVDPNAGASEDSELLHKHMGDVLAKVDANADGKISKDEVHAHMNKATLARIEADNESIRAKTKSTVAQELKKHDHDKDGLVHIDEMFKGSAEPEVDQFGRHKKQLFNVADADKDQKLSKEELEFFMHPEVHTRASEYNAMIVKEQFDDVDKDKDGQISWAEHWKSVTHGHDFGAEQMEHLDKNEKELFQENDKDKSGSLSLEELTSLLFPDLSKINFHGPQVDHIHGTIDKDGDGHLTLDELKKHGPMVMSALGGLHDEM